MPRAILTGVVDPIPTLSELRTRPLAQQPLYADPAAVDAVLAELRLRPPLVFAGECDELKRRIEIGRASCRERV